MRNILLVNLHKVWRIVLNIHTFLFHENACRQLKLSRGEGVLSSKGLVNLGAATLDQQIFLRFLLL